MKIKRILTNWLIPVSCTLGLAIFQAGFIWENTVHAADTLRPKAYTDYAGKTIGGGAAIDKDIDTAAEVVTDADASPSIIFHSWGGNGTEYSSLTLYVLRSSTGHRDDEWGIMYSTNGGMTWWSLDGMSSENKNKATVNANLNPLQDLSSLLVRIDSDRNRGPDSGRVYIYDIRIEGEPLVAPTLEQSAYRFFKNIDSLDLSAIAGNVPGDDQATAIIANNGFLYIAGYELGGWRIEKRSVDDGHLEVSSTNDSGGSPRALATDGSFLYVIGDDNFSGNYRWRIEKRYLSDLALVSAFGTNGVIISDPSTHNESPNGIVIDSNFMYVIGSDRANGANDAQWRLEKRSLTDGSLADFITNNLSADDDIPMGIAADSTYLYIVGYDRIPGSERKRGKGKGESNAEWRIEKRRISDLLLVAEVTDDNPTDNFDTARAIAIAGNFMYVIGCQELGFFNMEWRIEKRRLENLAFDVTFGQGGVITSDYGNDDQPQAIAVDSAFMYVVGHSAAIGGGGDTAWQIEKRSLSTGELEYSVTEDIDADNNDRAYAVAIDSGYMYIAGYWNPNLPEWRIEKRFLVYGTSAFLPDPLADQNVPTAVRPGEQFRLRLLISVTSGTLIANAQQFKLQFSPGCNESWYDVDSGTPIVFADNPTAAHGYPLVANLADPAEVDVLTRNQTYVEANYFTNSISAIEAGEAGMWDLSLSTNGVSPGEEYCLRVVKADGSSLEVYAQTPRLTIY